MTNPLDFLGRALTEYREWGWLEDLSVSSECRYPKLDYELFSYTSDVQSLTSVGPDHNTFVRDYRWSPDILIGLTLEMEDSQASIVSLELQVNGSTLLCTSGVVNAFLERLMNNESGKDAPISFKLLELQSTLFFAFGALSFSQVGVIVKVDGDCDRMQICTHSIQPCESIMQRLLSGSPRSVNTCLILRCLTSNTLPASVGNGPALPFALLEIEALPDAPYQPCLIGADVCLSESSARIPPRGIRREEHLLRRNELSLIWSRHFHTSEMLSTADPDLWIIPLDPSVESLDDVSEILYLYQRGEYWSMNDAWLNRCISVAADVHLTDGRARLHLFALNIIYMAQGMASIAFP